MSSLVFDRAHDAVSNDRDLFGFAPVIDVTLTARSSPASGLVESRSKKNEVCGVEDAMERWLPKLLGLRLQPKEEVDGIRAQNRSQKYESQSKE